MHPLHLLPRRGHAALPFAPRAPPPPPTSTTPSRPSLSAGTSPRRVSRRGPRLAQDTADEAKTALFNAAASAGDDARRPRRAVTASAAWCPGPAQGGKAVGDGGRCRRQWRARLAVMEGETGDGASTTGGLGGTTAKAFAIARRPQRASTSAIARRPRRASTAYAALRPGRHQEARPLATKDDAGGDGG